MLGFTPDEVVNKPCWDFFSPNEVGDAKKLHSKGVELDKAAVLAYCTLLRRDGYGVVCECCFTCVYNVMVVCTSVYQRGAVSSQSKCKHLSAEFTAYKGTERATEAPVIRRLFTSSPKDPRYHMLSHLSTKFQSPIEESSHEPRAALFLNRFTRTLTIMYATSGIEQVIGISGEDMKGRSFYYCIAENCLEDAVKCLETAKGNDSIAYLRFWFRDPRQDDQPSDASETETEDAEMTEVTDTEDEDGGVRLEPVPPPPLESSSGTGSGSSASASSRERTTTASAEGEAGPSQPRARDTHEPATPASTNSGANNQALELEAVVSCTSDGLVVILRRARPLMPGAGPDQLQTGNPVQANPRGMFAAPWAPEPMFIPEQPRPAHQGWFHGMHPQYVQPNPAPAGPSPQAFLNSIREVAVFAWALVGINGNLADYGRGLASATSQPRELPMWETYHGGRDNDSGVATGTETSPDPFGHAGPGANIARG